MLQLKSSTKQMFLDAGLEGFTIGRNNSNHLAIVGPCGKDIVEVTNFPVGTKLTLTERKIAIEEYIEPTLKKHSKVILDMIKFKELEVKADKAVKDAVEAENVDPKVSASMCQSGYGDYKKFSGAVIFSNSDSDAGIVDYTKAMIGSDGQLEVVLNASTSAIAKANIGLGADLEKRLMVLVGLYNNYITARKDFDDANASMQEECAL